MSYSNEGDKTFGQFDTAINTGAKINYFGANPNAVAQNESDTQKIVIIAVAALACIYLLRGALK
jgi:hypothetical protein